jgi:hypothetical protein
MPLPVVAGMVLVVVVATAALLGATVLAGITTVPIPPLTTAPLLTYVGVT